MARAIAAPGCRRRRVVVNYLDTPAEADAVVRRSEGGGDAVAIQADIGRRGESRACSADAADRYGHVDILVNNAAVAILALIVDAAEDQIDTVLNVNVKGTLFWLPARRAAPRDGGRVINISSSTTGLALPDTASMT